MKALLFSLPRGIAGNLKLIVVLSVMSAAVALLSDRVFSPWQFDRQAAIEASPSQIPRVVVRP